MQEPLMAWAAVSGRDLPWRHTRDPWAVLVSEAMLQQTQVPRVVPRYPAFMEQFPTAAATAAVPVAEVVRAWAGLGYNRRAVGLHRAAVAVVERHGGVVPGTLAELLALPGVGPYTARAVLAFAYEADVGVVEVNTARVLARAVAGSPVSGKEAQALADAVVPTARGWAWNQAMVDLGATVCTRSTPSCDQCPLRPSCRWALTGRPPPDPAAPAGRQSRFAGSDRQGRGRLVDALRLGPVALGDVAVAAGWPDDPDRAARMATALVADGLAVEVGDMLRLP
jgi:A/G-specific adenine glycosylase